MEDFVMRKSWLTLWIAVVCVVHASAALAVASPAGIRLAAKPSTPKVSRSEASQPVAARPSGQISPWKNPIQYLRASVAEMPIRSPFKWGKKDGPAGMVAQQPPKPSDTLSLDKPVGPPSPQLLISMAQLTESKGDIPQARQQYQHALSLWPGNAEVLRAAARMEDRQGQLPLAASLYQQAVATNPQHAGTLNDLGLCLARQGQLEASVATLEQAIQLQPEKALYRNNVATVLVELHQNQKALAHLTAVHGAAEANYNLGQLLVRRGHASEAAACFETAIQNDPSMEAARLALVQMRSGKMVMPSASTPVNGASVMETPRSAQQSAPYDQSELQFPATARSPEFGASSYLPPAYQAPRMPYPVTNVPQMGNTAPRYLPPVGSPGPGWQR
jgi:tetratricopeptide (TPR) repeat protein